MDSKSKISSRRSGQSTADEDLHGGTVDTKSNASSKKSVKFNSEELHDQLHSDSKASSKVSEKSTAKSELQNLSHLDSKTSSRKISTSVVQEDPSLHSESKASSGKSSKSKSEEPTIASESKKESKESSLKSEKSSPDKEAADSLSSSETFKVLKLGRSADDSTVLSGTMREWMSISGTGESALSMRENYDYGGLPYKNQLKASKAPDDESNSSALFKSIKFRSGDRKGTGHRQLQRSKNTPESSKSTILEGQESSELNIMLGRDGHGTAIAPSVTFTVQGKRATTDSGRDSGGAAFYAQKMSGVNADGEADDDIGILPEPTVETHPIVMEDFDQTEADEKMLNVSKTPGKKWKFFGRSKVSPMTAEKGKPKRSFFSRRKNKVSGLIVSARATDKALQDAGNNDDAVLPEDTIGSEEVELNDIKPMTESVLEPLPVAEPVPVTGPEPVLDTRTVPGVKDSNQHTIKHSEVTRVKGPKTIPPTESEETVIYSCFCTLL